MKENSKLPSDCEISLNRNQLILSCAPENIDRVMSDIGAIASWAVRFNVEKALVRCRVGGASSDFHIPLSNRRKESQHKSAKQGSIRIFSGKMAMDVAMVEAMAEMVASDQPMALVEMESDRQIWINDPMVSLLETPPAEATKRDMKDFWLPGDLAELKKRCSQESRFVHRYQGGLNPRSWASLETEFRIFESLGHFYRLAKNMGCDRLPYPTESAFLVR